MITTFGEIYKIGVTRLEQAGIDNAKHDAESLMLYMMHEDKNFLFVHKNDCSDETHAEGYFALVDRRASGEPLQYIEGTQEFMGLPFEVTPDVLIPRQDTETLVELAIDEAKKRKGSLDILDMCCGSGAIAVSMAHFLPRSKVTACDVSEAALAIARKNAKKNGVEKRITFAKTDMFEKEKHGKRSQIKGKYDMILCNPPYIETDVIPTLQTEVKDHEPMLALDGGKDGLDFYRLIARDAAAHLKKKGQLMLEIGCDQAAAVTALLDDAGFYIDIAVHQDLPGLDRVITCQRVEKLKPATE